MASKSVISVGVFGRLSVIAAPRQEVHESIVRQQNRHSYGDLRALNLNDDLTSDLPSATLAKALPAILIDLSALVDAIVLSDELLVFSGYDSDLWNTGPTLGQPYSFYFTQLWPEEANQLLEVATDGLQSSHVWSTKKRLQEAELLLDLPQREIPATYITGALKSDSIDFDYLRDIISDDMGCNAGTGGTLEQLEAAHRKLLDFVDTYLGADWQEYRRTVSPEINWPAALRRFPRVDGDILERSQALIRLGLFSELEIALEQATLGLSSLPAGSYFSLLASSSSSLRTSLTQITARSYQKQLGDDLARFGVVCLDLELPPFLRFCLHRAKDLFEVLRNAARLSKERRVVNLRRHLDEIAQTTDPLKLRRYLLRLETYIQAGLEGLAGLTPASLGVSTSSGNLTLSLSSSIISGAKRLLAWRQPVVMVHTKLQRALTQADSIGDLARIFQVPRAIAAKAIQASRQLQGITHDTE